MRISLIGLAMLAVLAACADTKGTEVKRGAMTSKDSADQVFYNVKAPLEVDGAKRGTLYADTLYVMNEQSRFDFTVGHVDFNTETGAPNGSMKADRGRYDQRTQTLEGWGHVLVKTVDGRSLKSPHVIYNQLRNEVSSDTTFELVAQGRTNSGIGFQSDPAFAHYHCVRACGLTGKVAIPK